MKSKFDFSDDSFEMVNNHKNRKSKRFEIFNLKKVFSLSGEVDYASTLDAIKEDISFKGTTSWVLICSIFIASIGLNTNSTAVVIGAMLIAPLMGPVLGIGVSLAINDLNLLRNAFFNFLVMVFLSVSTASLFFLSFPLQQESSELLSRTSPDIRDVFIAFFGGAALAVAKTKKGTIASVIYGVAIATALMPPLCTIGYGISQLNLKYAVGAFYLFSINATYIAFASFVVIKILRFPMIKYELIPEQLIRENTCNDSCSNGTSFLYF